jgi:chromosome segregation ATPase
VFTFRSVELLHWDLWDHVRMPLDGQVVMLTGPNGCGKTTFLDAMRVLLNARRLSTSRRIESYLRGEVRVAVIKGVVTNELRRGTGHRPFTRRGIFDDQATLACVVERGTRGLARRYCILPGDVPLKQLQGAEGWMGPEAYSTALEEAGVPRTMLKVLALEQGETHRLARRTPEQLLEYVLEMQGDHEVLERYALAVQHYRNARAELDELDTSILEHERHISHLEEEASVFERFARLKEEAHLLRSRRLPAARLRGVRRRLGDTRKALTEREEALAGIRSESGESETELERKRRELSLLDKRRAEIARAQKDLLAEKDAADKKARSLRKRMDAVDRLRDEVREAGDLDLPDEPEQVLRALRDEEARQLVALRALEEEVDAAEIAAGAPQPAPPLPAFVRRAVAEMSSAGIGALPVAHALRITEGRWRLAVESLLGKDRFTLLVPKNNSLAARKVARSLRYPCYVTDRSGEGPRRGEAARPASRTPEGARSALSVVDVEDPDVPRWLLDRLAGVALVEDLESGLRLSRDSVTITEDGYRQDRRGGIHVAAERLHCLHGAAGGGDGSAATAELDLLREQLVSSQHRLARAMARREALEAGLRARKAKARLAEEEDRVKEIIAESEAEDRRRRELSGRIYDLVRELEEIHEARVAGERTLARREAALETVQTRQRALRESLLEARATLARLTDEESALVASLPPEARTEAALELEGTPESLEERLRLLDEQVEQQEEGMDPRVVEVYHKALAELSGRKAHLARRREEHEAGHAELERARKAYLRVLDETVRNYRAHIMTLAERARIDAVVRAPRPRMDADGAAFKGGLEIRLGFDGKSPLPLGHPKMSGGQNVISSLILLMALTMRHGQDLSGFFILDEPFAHLSSERIEEVARFLRMTRAQFVLTSPTTHNLMTYQPADLVVTLRKMPQGASTAPPPIFVRAA